MYITYHWIYKKNNNPTFSETVRSRTHTKQIQARQLRPVINNSIHKHAQEVLFKEDIGHFCARFLIYLCFCAENQTRNNSYAFKVHFTLQQMDIIIIIIIKKSSSV